MQSDFILRTWESQRGESQKERRATGIWRYDDRPQAKIGNRTRFQAKTTHAIHPSVIF
jgi:hypothetical protein